MDKKKGKSEAIILVKAASQVSRKYDESVYCVGVTTEGKWVRLYPVIFKKLKDIQQFNKWSRIKFEWQAPVEDPRPESQRVYGDSISIIGELSSSERHNFLSKLETTASNSLTELTKQGKSLALLRPQKSHFFMVRKTEAEITEEQQAYKFIMQQKKLHNPENFMPLIKPCPYTFRYRYSVNDGAHEGIYQDWEINAMFSDWSRSYGEEQALARITKLFGEEYPRKKMVFIVSADSLRPPAWVINAVICMDQVCNVTGPSFNLVV